jgi:HD superfamily phosphodiesterase
VATEPVDASERSLNFDPELLYVGALFHDIGLVEGHRSERERFEIDGANAFANSRLEG